MAFIARLLLPLVASAFLVGCAATVSQGGPELSRVAAAPAAAKNVVLAMTGPSGSNSGANWEAFKEEWQTSLTAALSSQGAKFAFSSATYPSAGTPAVLLKMQVNEYRYVSQAKRYAVGIFSGNASLDIEVEFIELPSNKSLTKRKYSASSSALQGAFSAMTPKQVEAVSKEIVQEINAR
jgi:uncharacterized lipoprotein YajG